MEKFFEIYKCVLFTIIAVALVVISVCCIRFAKCLVKPTPGSSNPSSIQINGNIDADVKGQLWNY